MAQPYPSCRFFQLSPGAGSAERPVEQEVLSRPEDTPTKSIDARPQVETKRESAENSRLQALLKSKDAEIAELHGELRRRATSSERCGGESTTTNTRFFFPAAAAGAVTEAPAPAPWQAARAREPAPEISSRGNDARPLLRPGASSVPAPGGIPWAAAPKGFSVSSPTARPFSPSSVAQALPDRHAERQRHPLDDEDLDVTRRRGLVPTVGPSAAADQLHHLAHQRSARRAGVEVCVEIASDNKPAFARQRTRPGSLSPAPPPPPQMSPPQAFRRVGSVEHVVYVAERSSQSARQATARQRGASATPLQQQQQQQQHAQQKSPLLTPRLRDSLARPGCQLASQCGSQPCSQPSSQPTSHAGSKPGSQQRTASLGRAMTAQMGGAATSAPLAWHPSPLIAPNQQTAPGLGQPQLWPPLAGQQSTPGSFVAQASAAGHNSWRGRGHSIGGCGATPRGLLPPPALLGPVSSGGPCAAPPPPCGGYVGVGPAAGSILPQGIQFWPSAAS